MRPIYTVAYLICVALTSCIILLSFPNEGVLISEELTLKYASFDDVLDAFKLQREEERTIEEILEQAEVIEIDSTAIKDSIRVAQIEHRNRMLSIQYPDSVESPLKAFYESLQGLSTGKKIRVLHYGDSQIEGDRITNLMRNKLQQKYGGFGPGILSVNPVARTVSVRMNRSKNWKRYTAFGIKNDSLAHNKYGLMACYSRFSSIHPLDIKPEFQASDSISKNNSDTLKNKTTQIGDDSTFIETNTSIFNGHGESKYTDTLRAWFEIAPTSRGYYRLRKFLQLHLLLGNSHESLTLKMILNDSIEEVKQLPPLKQPQKISYTFSNTPEKVRIEFKGFASPDIYGVSLESNDGIIMDNIPMRGSSGTIFRKIDTEMLALQFKNQGIKLIMFQFGGNSVPHLKEEEKVQSFAKYFGYNIQKLRRLIPDASFLVIGPSDMSVKDGSTFTTYPILESLRDALKEVSFKQGAAYWDLYEVMGGKNSMPIWVDSDPPLAGKDYVHFTWKGSNKVAELLHSAISKDMDKTMNRE